MVERSLSMREVLGSMPRYSILCLTSAHPYILPLRHLGTHHYHLLLTLPPKVTPPRSQAHRA